MKPGLRTGIYWVGGFLLAGVGLYLLWPEWQSFGKTGRLDPAYQGFLWGSWVPVASIYIKAKLLGLITATGLMLWEAKMTFQSLGVDYRALILPIGKELVSRPSFYLTWLWSSALYFFPVVGIEKAFTLLHRKSGDFQRGSLAQGEVE